MLDKALLFEHTLRDHVKTIRTQLQEFLAEQGAPEHYQGVNISYSADDGGRWQISHYYNKITTDYRGAELAVVAAEFQTLYRSLHKSTTLRSLIAGPAEAAASADNV